MDFGNPASLFMIKHTGMKCQMVSSENNGNKFVTGIRYFNLSFIGLKKNYKRF